MTAGSPKRRAIATLLFLCGVGGCGDASSPECNRLFCATEPLLLSTGSPTKDEDPSLLRAWDGRMFVAWFSDRGGNPDIYITNTADGATWSPATRVTTSTGGDFNPSLFQDDQGIFHLAWFRWQAPSLGHIYYNRSADGVTWDPLDEVQVTTTAAVDDWVPTLTQSFDGTLLIYFVSSRRDESNPTSQMYVAVKRPTDIDWSAASPLADLNSPDRHDHLPFAARTGDEVTLSWVRYDSTATLPWLAPKSDVFCSTSFDGLSWPAPVQVTQEAGNVVNLFPGLYLDHAGRWSFNWLSTRTGPPRPYALPLTQAADYPAGLAEISQLPSGYSHRIVATPEPGMYLGAWVQGPEGEQDIWVRFFAE
jgi:hypothetical protein